MQTSSPFKNGYLLFVYILLYLPIFILILYSFNDANYAMQFKGLSLKWYRKLIDDFSLWQSIINSTLLAIVSSTVTTIICSLGAIYLHFYTPRGKTSIQQLIFLLIIIPDIILAVGFLLLFHTINVRLGFLSLLIAHITFSIPFAMLVLQNRLKKMDPNLLKASQDLGASDSYTLKKVILPLMKNACLSAWLLSFTLSFDDVLISYFTAGPEFQILPLYIYSLIRTGIKPEINALCSIVFCFSLITVCGAYALTMKKEAQ